MCVCLEGPFSQFSGNSSYPEGVEEGDLGALLFLQHTKKCPNKFSQTAGTQPGHLQGQKNREQSILSRLS